MLAKFLWQYQEKETWNMRGVGGHNTIGISWKESWWFLQSFQFISGHNCTESLEGMIICIVKFWWMILTIQWGESNWFDGLTSGRVPIMVTGKSPRHQRFVHVDIISRSFCLSQQKPWEEEDYESLNQLHFSFSWKVALDFSWRLRSWFYAVRVKIDFLKWVLCIITLHLLLACLWFSIIWTCIESKLMAQFWWFSSPLLWWNLKFINKSILCTFTCWTFISL